MITVEEYLKKTFIVYRAEYSGLDRYFEGIVFLATRLISLKMYLEEEREREQEALWDSWREEAREP